MSRLFFLKTNKKIELKDVFHQLSEKYQNLCAEEGDENYVHFYLNKMSIRGVYVSIEDYGFEIKSNILSNEYDLMLTNDLLKCISEMTNGKIFDEDNNLLTNDENIKNTFKRDLETIFQFIKETGKTMEFPGPTRSFFIGKKMYNTYKNFSKDKLVQVFQEIIMHVLYGLPDYHECSPFGAQSKEKDKVVKLKIVPSNDNYIIQDYNYIMIGNEDETKTDEVIMISVEKITEILPKDWQIIDESTIVAVKLSDNDWDEFRKKCAENNCYELFREETVQT